MVHRFHLIVLSLFLLSSCQVNPYRDGEQIYKTQCANCHMDSGEGLSSLIPTLAQSDYLAPNRATLPCILRHGLRDTITVNGKIFAEQMPANATLSEVDIVNVLNFVNHAWGNHLPPYSLDEVRKALEGCDPSFRH